MQSLTTRVADDRVLIPHDKATGSIGGCAEEDRGLWLERFAVEAGELVIVPVDGQQQRPGRRLAQRVDPGEGRGVGRRALEANIPKPPAGVGVQDADASAGLEHAYVNAIIEVVIGQARWSGVVRSAIDDFGQLRIGQVATLCQVVGGNVAIGVRIGSAGDAPAALNADIEQGASRMTQQR